MTNQNETSTDQLASLFMLPPVCGLIWLYFISQKPLIFAMDAMSTCGLVTVLASAVLVGMDANKLGFGSEEAEGWMHKQSPAAWGIACAILWFPMYIVYGFTRVGRGGTSRALPVLLLSILFVLAYFGMYSLIEEKLTGIRSMFGQ